MPVWHYGDPAGWNRYKGLVPWHQADRTGEIKELLELPLMIYTTKLYILYNLDQMRLLTGIVQCHISDRPGVAD